MDTSPKLIISVLEARKILGKDGEKLSDEQVEKVIRDFTAIVGLYIESVPK